jgi:pimeloyl-ACP methyl ester carboxylesterase
MIQETEEMGAVTVFRGRSVWVAAALTAGAVALTLSGCLAMRPYAEVAAMLPAERLVAVGDQRVHVVDVGTGEPLVLLHGFGASTLIWDAVVPSLARSRRVVAIDLNGFGWTERPRAPEAYTLDGQERLVLGVADALGLDRFDLGGHSYGGAISIFLASRHPERVRSLLLVDSAMPAYGTLRRRDRFAHRGLTGIYVRTIGLTKRRVRAGLKASYADDSKVTPALVEAYLERLRVEGVEDAFYGLTAPTGAPPDRIDLAALAMPALLVWGSEDELTPAADGRAAAATMPDATFVELPDCGHSPMEECPAAFVDAVEPFLERIAFLP